MHRVIDSAVEFKQLVDSLLHGRLLLFGHLRFGGQGRNVLQEMADFVERVVCRLVVLCGECCANRLVQTDQLLDRLLIRFRTRFVIFVIMIMGVRIRGW